ncbi:uncharacterized protein LOC131166070 [Malania oleifera]|uniref:uncharacterized protein LOC131166070 n=1 Tax=Malania oleifera TaxID=397392 RepID=UPI0025AE85A9|nr:uncharacterized protein LOC131166070 [Malania oleifera]
MASGENCSNTSQRQDTRYTSIFSLPADFFNSCRLLPPHFPLSSSSFSEPRDSSATSTIETQGEDSYKDPDSENAALSRWSCNTCKVEFESLNDQRSHFKSDFHRFNVKLSIAGKNIVKEEDFDDSNSDSLFKDYDISSISGSEDEAEKRSCNVGYRRPGENIKHKLFIHLRTGEKVSIWKCLFLDESESIQYNVGKSFFKDGDGCSSGLRESEVIEKLKNFTHEPRDNTNLRIVLLASGGHFAGCVFDGNTVVAHKTFHRYVVRAKAGKRQSSKDASGKAANSAGASLRRYNELALKKEIQEILAAWKPYFDSSCCVFIYAPSSNRQLLFNGEKPYFSSQHSVIRRIPLTVRRPTLKEARRIYNQLIQVTSEVDEAEFQESMKEDSPLNASTMCNCNSETSNLNSLDNVESNETMEACSSYKKSDERPTSSESESEVINKSTPLHEAAKSGNAQKVLELLEQGFDPSIKDERGRTPYMLAAEREVRNSFRRFMAKNLDKWDWHAAKVPSALTKEMEDSQAAKQAEKDAKKKARSKELKKLRKAREKKAQAALSEKSGTALENRGATSLSVTKGKYQPSEGISNEEELKKKQAEEREKRAAAAERRMVAANAGGTHTNIAPTSSQPRSGIGTDVYCSCCNASLAGKIPFHRYNYKYCSTTCMHVHREFLEDG